jgi:hypothetical protein
MAVVFIHIPKMGGTSLLDVLVRQYRAGAVHVLARPIRNRSRRSSDSPRSGGERSAWWRAALPSGRAGVL